MHFENSLQQKIDSNILVVTFDVTNQYSNIPHELGKQTISFWIDTYSETLQSRFNKWFIIDDIELIPNNNSFLINNLNYIQTQGTAMGIKIATTYATLTLAYLEENLYEIIGKEYGNNIKG